MVTIKSYSDLQQSRKLAEILPLESADMIYTMTNGYHTPFIRIETIQEMDKDDVPCWSLAALISVLPNDTSLLYFDDAYQMVYDKKPYVISNKFDNTIDVCYELILKLHELVMV